MGIFDAISAAESGINVARYRSEVTAQNLANVYTPGYQRQVVDVQPGVFSNMLNDASGTSGSVASGAANAYNGAVRVTGTHTQDLGDPRQNSLQGALDMMDAKDDYETNVRMTSLLKSMALAALEIGRGG
jgi:flagellar basal body rod protein FlgB